MRVIRPCIFTQSLVETLPLVGSDVLPQRPSRRISMPTRLAGDRDQTTGFVGEFVAVAFYFRRFLSDKSVSPVQFPHLCYRPGDKPDA